MAEITIRLTTCDHCGARAVTEDRGGPVGGHPVGWYAVRAGILGARRDACSRPCCYALAKNTPEAVWIDHEGFTTPPSQGGGVWRGLNGAPIDDGVKRPEVSRG